MKYFITGATGFIGLELTKHLLQQGHIVHVLVRSKQKASLLNYQNVKLFYGNLFSIDIISKAMEGCDFVFHLAGYAKPWSKNRNLPFKINVEGTRNILKLSFQNRIKRVVFTSSAGTLKPSDNDEEINELSPMPASYLTDYETTKREAEELCQKYVSKGLDVVIVNPTRVYGPGLLSKSNSVTLIIKKYNEGKWRFVPGNGTNIGNYVYILDVVAGHVLALEKGKTGGLYILGGDNLAFNDFFKLLSKNTGKKQKLFNLPLWMMMMVAIIMMIGAILFGIEPLITPAWVKRYNQNRVVSSNKAIKNLGYTFTPINEGISKTLDWLKSEKP